MQTIREASLLMRLPARLDNWRNWLRQSPLYGQCASLEGNWRSPQTWYPPGPKPERADEKDAWEINLAAATLVMRLHLLLRLKYLCYGLTNPEIAAIMRKELHIRIRHAEVDDIDYEARLALLDALAVPIVIRRQRAVAKEPDQGLWRQEGRRLGI